LNNTNIKPEELNSLFLMGTPLIDVRAPVEFNLGSLPHAVNLPIMNDEERSAVGTMYKQQGRAEALRLGHELVSDGVKADRIKKWSNFIERNPDAIIYCFRGGLRSQITQQWLKEAGIDRPLIIGGYKRARNHLLEKTNQIIQGSNFMLVSGPTGSGKTQLLNSSEVRSLSINLEELAQHRGSAFGARSTAQPTQINFENKLAIDLIRQNTKNKKGTILFEDESRLIGKNIIPAALFEKMRESSVIWIEEDLSKRVQNIYADYILNSDLDKPALFAGFKKSVKSIEKKLGGLRAQEILTLLGTSQKEFFLNGSLDTNKQWIEKLLVYYYDPLYLGSIQRREVKIAFKGSLEACRSFISALDRSGK
jgi:tRNA 2-selenouridine synthase